MALGWLQGLFAKDFFEGAVAALCLRFIFSSQRFIKDYMGFFARQSRVLGLIRVLVRVVWAVGL